MQDTELSKAKKNAILTMDALKSDRTVNGRTSSDVRFFLTSLDNLNLVKKAIRLHWGIENRQFRQTVLRLI